MDEAASEVGNTVGELMALNSNLLGKPTIPGTRITVESIVDRLAAGETTQQILEAHPRLTEDAIRAGLAFAAKSLRADVVYPVGEATT